VATTGIDPHAVLDTILVATDFSETAGLALDRACELATKHAAKLVLVHVLANPPIPLAGPVPVLLPLDIEDQIRAVSHEKLEVLAQGVRDLGLETEVRLVTGRPGPQIVGAASEARVDLIVIGTRGLSGFRHALLGSTAEHVVRRAPCPVLTVHPESREALSGVKTVIIPTELHEDPTPAVDLVVRVLGKKAQAVSLILVYSDHLPAYLQPLVVDLGIEHIGFDEIERRLHERLAPVAAKLAGTGFSVETVIEEGDPATVITELASSRAADLIAMHTHGREGLAHLIQRSVAERVVQHARCPVITLRLAAEPQGSERAD